MYEPNHRIAAEFKPAKSAIFTLGSLLIAATLIVWGAWYISEDKLLAGSLLFIPGTLAGFASYLLGFRSSKDQDLEDGHPFQISASDSAYELSADPRTSQDVLLNLIATAAQTMKDRKPLPEASGIVGKDGTGVASGKEEANKTICAINQQQVNDMTALEAAMTVEQKIDPAIVAKAPTNKEPESR
ncbi:hypothetical protein [Microbulbifer hainanensis]|uniref:hypothetical protein n=1 Tax=Microbulbifer hainanensis TaxID=2735675 RepID=UPI0018676F25|nr:hypothetical protein [Microbulbifer hainanensis]